MLSSQRESHGGGERSRHREEGKDIKHKGGECKGGTHLKGGNGSCLDLTGHQHPYYVMVQGGCEE